MPQGAWVTAATGLRRSIEVGAHRNKAYKLDPTLTQELWKRAFWYESEGKDSRDLHSLLYSIGDYSSLTEWSRSGSDDRVVFKKTSKTCH